MRARLQADDESVAMPDSRQRRRRERPFLETPRRRDRLDPRGREKQVVAAAGMDTVVKHRLAVRRQGHAPDDTVEMTGEHVENAVTRAFRHPRHVDQLYQGAILEAG